MVLSQLVSACLLLLALAGLLYQASALVLVDRFFASAAPPPRSAAAVSLLKPLHGAEPLLTARLASFLGATHHGPLQMVCGVNDAQDGAVPAATAVQAAHAQADIVLSCGPRGYGANGKIGNLIAMLPMAKHDTLVLSDSDMEVPDDYLARVLAALAEPGVGAVSCLYAGRGNSGVWSHLGAAAISYAAMPNMVVGLVSGLARPCMGSTIAIRRETLAAIGGFGRFADILADDHAIGAAVAEHGLRVAVPPMLLVHAGAERSLAELWRHHLRWAVTIRGLAPAGHTGSLLTHAVPLALIAALAQPLAGGVMLIAALCLRIGLGIRVDGIHGRKSAPLWMIPVADCLCFAVFCASFAMRRVEWRGAGLTLASKGRIIAEAKRV